MTATAPNVITIPANPELVKAKAVRRQLRVAAYCRVSADSEEQLTSYEAQKNYYTDKIMTNPDWTMAGIFADEVYTGDMVQGKHINIGHKQVPTKPEEWIVVRNTHEPIISREMFAKAQAVRRQAAEKSKAQAEKIPYTANILRGRIFCGHCGGHLNRHRNKQGQYYFSCIAKERISKDACSGSVYVKEDLLFRTIVTIIRQKAEVVMGEAFRLKQGDSKIAAQKTQVDQGIAELGRQTQKNKTLLAGLYESFVKGILTRAE